MNHTKAVFLDRDGVINKDHIDYTYSIEKFIILPGVLEAIQLLKKAGYTLVIVTNQSGIAKGIYQPQDVLKCWSYLQEKCNHQIDAHYYAPHHPDYDTASLSRKPDSLMIEKGLAKFNIPPPKAWLIGDSERDLIAAKKQNLRTVYLPKQSAKFALHNQDKSDYADFIEENLLSAAQLILQEDGKMG